MAYLELVRRMMRFNKNLTPEELQEIRNRPEMITAMTEEE